MTYRPRFNKEQLALILDVLASGEKTLLGNQKLKERYLAIRKQFYEAYIRATKSDT